jgi:hypothetical protein
LTNSQGEHGVAIRVAVLTIKVVRGQQPDILANLGPQQTMKALAEICGPSFRVYVQTE